MNEKKLSGIILIAVIVAVATYSFCQDAINTAKQANATANNITSNLTNLTETIKTICKNLPKACEVNPHKP